MQTVVMYFEQQLQRGCLCVCVVFLYVRRSVHMYVCLSLCLSVCLSICLYVCVSMCVCLSVCLSICLSVCLSICLYVCVSTCLSVCLSIRLYVCVSMCLSVCLSDSYSLSHLLFYFAIVLANNCHFAEMLISREHPYFIIFLYFTTCAAGTRG